MMLNRDNIFIKNEEGRIRKAKVTECNLVFFTVNYNDAEYTVSWEDLIKSDVNVSGYSVMKNEFGTDIGFKLSETFVIGRSIANVDDKEVLGI